ncbi:sodium channel protein Nach-like [Periplaneta americana]|uniref:sodium channel protein Nach-like n=1 Tax=Periplaneta americana TaxID=6978 RepID=UPI0037E7A744
MRSSLMYPKHTYYLPPDFDDKCSSLPEFCPKSGLRMELLKEQMNCTTNLVECNINGKKFPCCDVFEYVQSEQGPCYGMNSQQAVHYLQSKVRMENYTEPNITDTTHRQLTVRIQLFEHTTVYGAHKLIILDREEVPFLDPQHKGKDVPLRQNTVYFYRIMETEVDPEVLSLNANQRGCYLLSKKEAGSFYPYYGFSTCMSECRARLMLQLCGCVHLYSPIRGNPPRCDIRGTKCLDANKDALFSAELSQMCNCLPRCQVTVIDVLGFITERSDYISILRIKIMASNSKLKLSLNRDDLDVFVTVGGVIGLFMGSSILSIVELVFFFTVRLGSALMKEILHCGEARKTVTRARN